MDSDVGARDALVVAIAHEIGNHLGGIRLEAHLLGDDQEPRALARASVGIDSMAARSGALLGLLRPLVAPGERSSGTQSWRAILGGVRQELVDEGTRGVELSIDLGPEPEPGPDSGARAALAAPAVGWLHHLLMAWLGSTLSQLQAREGEKGRVSVEFVPGEAESFVIFEDNAPQEDLSDDAPRRERPLALAIARVLLGELGGRVETNVETNAAGETLTRVTWCVPKPPELRK